MWKKALVLILLTSMLLIPFIAATQYSVNTGREVQIETDVAASSDMTFYTIGVYWSPTKGNDQWSPTFYDYELGIENTVNIDAGTKYLIADYFGGDDPDTTVYDDEKAAFILYDKPQGSGAYDPLAFFYFEDPTVMTEYSYWFVWSDAPADIDPNNWDTVTYTISVMDSQGNPVSYTKDYKIYVDLVSDDSGDYGITSDNEGLFFNVLRKYFNYWAGTPDNVSRLYITALDDDSRLRLPKWVYYGDEYDTVEKPYKLQIQVELEEDGETYTSEVKDVDTSDGSMALTFTLANYTSGGEPSDFIYVSFYYDEDLQSPVYVDNYNISVVKAFSPDGLSMPSSHTYELYNYYTLKIPVDDSYPYAVVTLKDDQGNVAFKKGYIMQAGSYSEALEGNKLLVKFQLYDVANNTFLDSFKIVLKGETTDYVGNTTTGSLTILVFRGNYTVEVYDLNDNLLYSTVLEVDSNKDLTYYVNPNYLERVKLIFVDSTLKPVFVGSVLERFDFYLTSSSGYYVDLEKTPAFKYSLNNYFMNNKGYYYIYSSDELQEWQSGVYLEIYDEDTGVKLKEYRLVLQDTSEFMIVLPYSVERDSVVNAPSTTVPYMTDTDVGEYQQRMMSSVMDWFFVKGFFMVLVVIGVAFTTGDVLGRGAGIYLGLALTLVFAYMGLLPKTIGLLTALGFSAVLLRELNISRHLPRGGGEE